MSKIASTFEIGMVAFNDDEPLYIQIYQAISHAILIGQLQCGTRLPSTRDIAKSLNVSRNTVINAFEQLIAEGFLETKIGSGTLVSEDLPPELLEINREATSTAQHPLKLSTFAKQLQQTTATTTKLHPEHHCFTYGTPALDAFPIEIWSKLLANAGQDIDATALDYGDACGYWPLRASIAQYLNTSRGVRCAADQILICSGSQQALNLIAQLLLNPHDVVWHEDPGYQGARGAFESVKANVIPILVDEHGITIPSNKPTPTLIYTTPSHQFPLGVNMPLERRLDLLNNTEGWIIEDDYDSEYRYTGRPIPALQGLDHQQRVIYVGTFSKVMFPAIRVGYIVLPPQLVDIFTHAQSILQRGAPTIMQHALHKFIEDGHLARHIRKMRLLYAERRASLLLGIQQHLHSYLEPSNINAGLHTVAWLKQNHQAADIEHRARQENIEVIALSRYSYGKMNREGLVLGFAAAHPTAIEQNIQLLKRVFEDVN